MINTCISVMQLCEKLMIMYVYLSGHARFWSDKAANTCHVYSSSFTRDSDREQWIHITMNTRIHKEI